MGRATRSLFASLALAACVATSAPAFGSTALELVRAAAAHEAAKEEDLAVRRYMEALALDPTCEEAYHGLGSLRSRHGDLREAERVYSLALEHLPALRAARLGRAYVRRALGARAEAVADLSAGGAEDPTALRILATWFGEEGQTPAQLAVWRRLAASAEAIADPVLLREARATVRALVILVGPADPAAMPATEDRNLRRLVAAIARKGG